MKNIYIYILFFSCNIFAQKPILEIDTNLLRIGEQFNIVLKVYDFDTTGLSIINSDSVFKSLELVNQTDWLNVLEKDTYLYKNLTFTSFDTGSFIINPISLISSNQDTISTNSLVVDFIAMQLDTTNQFFDIKPPKDIPFLTKELLKYLMPILILLLLFVLVIWLIRYFQRRNKIQLIDQPFRSIPIDVYFLEKLDQLENKNYLQKERYKEFYTELSEIFRGYLEQRFSIPALESSTYDLKELLSKKDIDQDWLNGFFRNNDVVKFAKGIPSYDESFIFLGKVKDFIVHYRVLVEEDDLLVSKNNN